MEIIRNLILLAIGGGLALLAVRSLRAQRLKERYALIFVLTGIPFLGLAIWRDGLAIVANWLNIDYRTVALLCVTIFFILMIFKLLSIVSVQERQITSLAQQIALLQNEHHRPTTPDASPKASSHPPS